jgi:hypothetical protein
MLFQKFMLTFLPLCSYQKTLPYNLTLIPSPVKTKLSLCLIKHHALKMGGWRYIYLCPYWKSNLVAQPVSSHYTAWATIPSI